MAYDSTKNTKIHVDIVKDYMKNKIIPKLEDRADHHDESKFESPEKEGYDKYIPMLNEVKYASPEYTKIRKEMGETVFKHHAKENRHHPEHFKNGINDMNLIDVVEMFIDWAASAKRSDTSFEDGIKYNKAKFHMSDQLYQIMLNTYKDIIKK